MRNWTVNIIPPVLICLILGCQKENNQFKPKFEIESKQTSGLTTDVFSIKVTPITTIPSDEKLHCRWDWEGDSIFNTRFTQELEVKHRFLRPGQYRVVCEVLSLSGERARSTLNFDIQQGYSSPKPVFNVTPKTGHFRTNFLFDASKTIDDEDSLETLKFRWDFQNDGVWDTPFLDETTINHQFENMQDYTVKLTVVDPSQRSGSFTKKIELHRTDTCIVPRFTWTSETSRAGDPFIFDASDSYHQTDTEIDLIFKWLFPEQEYTEGSTNPVIEHVFTTPGTKRVVLAVEDGNGLQNTLAKEFFVAIENLPPKPKILTPTNYGNIETQFYLNLWDSRDDHTAPSKLLYRWDFDGDGIWDTEKNSKVESYHQYMTAGTYKCILEAEDEHGLSDTTSLFFYISPYDYPTGYIKDKRDNKLYGTVKIGNLWWMSENLDFRPEPKVGTQHVQTCYNNNASTCDKYGALYAIEYAMSYEDYFDHSICPDSWHIPTKEDLDDLINHIDIKNGREELAPMGRSGFNALYSGYVLYSINIVDGKREFNIRGSKDLGFSTYFITTSYRPSLTFPSVFSLQIIKNQSEIFPINTDMEGFYSVRCVKD
jgi:uncharacterized protein (TIGR02145 family)